MSSKGRRVGNLVSAQTGVAVTVSGDPIVLGVGNTELVRITGSGNIGIGTDNPTRALTVVGSGTSTSQLFVTGITTVAAGSTAAPSITPTGDTNTGIFFPSADTIAFAEGGAEALRIDSSGNLKLSTAATSILNSSGNKILNQTGSILQVVNATYSTIVSSSSSTYANTNLTASITPSSTSSKILVLVNHNGCGKDATNTQIGIKLFRGATEIALIENPAGYTASTATNYIGSISTCYLDSPSSTSSVTYKTQFASLNNAQTVYLQVNSTVSTITLMEIAA